MVIDYTTFNELYEATKLLREIRPDIAQIAEFLNSIEGDGYGGMANYEIAREAANTIAEKI